MIAETFLQYRFFFRCDRTTYVSISNEEGILLKLKTVFSLFHKQLHFANIDKNKDFTNAKPINKISGNLISITKSNITFFRKYRWSETLAA